ncbi:ribosomal protein L7/L12 [Catenulispora rubra]|uniref:ribosomal protein L7/L12 n=1 Tax=Catenulispora rubra TaxID=280293 RepID=UPI0018923D60|nr:ribosomal protein L7/L12 [Catenulispora rubra]
MDSGDHITVEMRLAAIEEKLDRVLAHLGLDGDEGNAGSVGRGLSQPVPVAAYEAQLTTLVQAGKKIQAIKLYREATGAGLKDAKDAVDTYERDLRARGGWR